MYRTWDEKTTKGTTRVRKAKADLKEKVKERTAQLEEERALFERKVREN